MLPRQIFASVILDIWGLIMGEMKEDDVSQNA